MEKIIALWECANQGKTSTLNCLIDILKVKTSHCEIPDPTVGDRQEIFNYHGKIIGVATAGDNMWCVEQGCAFFEKNQCDIVITATRSKGVTCRVLEEFASKYRLDIIWVKKIVCEEPTLMKAANLIQAYKLFDLIE